MTLLLCPECCQWREPAEGRCSVCAGTLDLAAPDPSLEALAAEVGDCDQWLGDAELLRSLLPKRGRLCATTNGLLFVPDESRVIVFSPPSPQRSEGNREWLRRWPFRGWPRLRGRGLTSRFACEQRLSEFAARDRIALAELLRSDPGVWFVARRSIARWRRPRGQWEFVRSAPHSWPERVVMRDRDGDRALQIWLEATECPLSVNVR